MSALGMDSQGFVRSAFEFKDNFDRTGTYNNPYRCPFCAIEYVDKCIANPCRKAPHFSLKSGTFHLGGCDGDGLTKLTPAAAPPASTDGGGRTVARDVDFPEALVEARRERGRFRPRPENALPLTSEEIADRRRRVDSSCTMDSKYTSSLLRTFVVAHRRLQDLAKTSAQAAGPSGSDAYNEAYRKAMHSRRIELYGDEFTYGFAFYNSRFSPVTTPRIYQGGARVRLVGNELVLHDTGLWPRAYKSNDRVEFFVVMDATPPVDCPKAHLELLHGLHKTAATATLAPWSVDGTAALTVNDGFVLRLQSLDHLFIG